MPDPSASLYDYLTSTSAASASPTADIHDIL